MQRLRIPLVALGLIAAGAAFALAQPAQPPERPHTWDNFAERHDVDGDGSVTREELMSTIGIFERLDADGDGVITDGDFAAHRDGMALAMLARHADDDEDGTLTRAELDDWFGDRDRNDDGVLDRDDFDRAGGPGAMRRGPDRHHARHHAFLHGAFDADGDGAVEQADLNALFDRYDADGDGRLTAEERPEVELGGMHGHRGHRRGGPGFGPGSGPGRG